MGRIGTSDARGDLRGHLRIESLVHARPAGPGEQRLLGLRIAAFVVEGDVRTNWVTGDTAPDLGEVALPRLGTLA